MMKPTEQQENFNYKDFIPVELTSLVAENWSNPKLNEVRSFTEVF